MQRAVLALAPLPDIVLVDAFRVPELPMAQRGVPHGDRRCSAIAAASIVAKVIRDREMLALHRTRSAIRIRSAQRATRPPITWTRLHALATPRRIVDRSGPRHCLIRLSDRAWRLLVAPAAMMPPHKKLRV